MLLQAGGLWGMNLQYSDNIHLSPSVICSYFLPSELLAPLIPQLTFLGVPGEPRNWSEPSRENGFWSLHGTASDACAQIHHTIRFWPTETVSDLWQAGKRADSDYPHYRLHMLLKPESVNVCNLTHSKKISLPWTDSRSAPLLALVRNKIFYVFAELCAL